ncbi:MAG: extracellular solute-binding protein [Butyricicoccaceae bacterium]
MPNAASVEAKSAVAQDYAQPYRGTTVILAYDSEKVPTPPKTMDELVEWMKANPGRFAYNAPGTGGAGDSFARTSVYNFLPEEAITSGDEKWVGEWDKGFEFLKSIHPVYVQVRRLHRLPEQEPGYSGPSEPGRDRHVPELG